MAESMLLAVLCPLAAAAQAVPGNAPVAAGNAALPAAGAEAGNAALPAAGAEAGNTALPAAVSESAPAIPAEELPLPESALPGAQTGLLGRSVEQVRVTVAGVQQSGWR